MGFMSIAAWRLPRLGNAQAERNLHFAFAQREWDVVPSRLSVGVNTCCVRRLMTVSG